MSIVSDANRRYFDHEAAIQQEVDEFRRELFDAGLSEAACEALGSMLERIIRLEGGPNT